MSEPAYMGKRLNIKLNLNLNHLRRQKVMRWLKSKKTVALILTIMMLFSNTAIAMAVAEKVQIGTVANVGVEQYDYDTVIPGGANRTRFITSLQGGLSNPKSVIIKDGETWYDVDGITLDAAKSAGRVSAPSASYVAILENGNQITSAAAVLIDDIDGAYPLDTLPKVQPLYDRYNALSAADKTAIAGSQTIVDLLAAYAALTQTGEGALTGINSVNGALVRVTVTGAAAAPAADAFAVSDSNGNPYTVSSVGIGPAANEYTLTLNNPVTGAGVLMITYNGVTLPFDFDTTSTGLKFILSSNASNGQLRSNGLDSATLTVTVMRNGVIETDFNGTVSFTSDRLAPISKGGEASFDNGTATVQLTSLNSLVEIEDHIVGTLMQTQDDPSLQGKKTNELIIRYVPDPLSGGEADDRIFMVSATSNNASRVYVTFNKAYDDRLTTALVRDVFRVSRDKDSAPALIPNGFKKVPNDGQTIELQFTQDRALWDNTDITVVTTGNGNYIAPNAVGATFTLNDTVRPAIFDVDLVDYGVIAALFSEPIVTMDAYAMNPNALVYAGNITNWSLNGQRLSAGDIIANGISLGILDETNTPVAYIPGDGGRPEDKRAYITIQLSPAGIRKLNAYGEEDNIVQIANVRDYAGLTDAANTAVTQEFRFPTPEPPAAPVPSIERQSPEQYKITFDQRLVRPLTSANIKFEHQTGPNTYAEIPTYSPEIESVLKEISLHNISGAANDAYLLELAADWTVIKDTRILNANPNGTDITYFTNNYNGIRITITSVPANVIENSYGREMNPPFSWTDKLTEDIESPTVKNKNEAAFDSSLYTHGGIPIIMSEPVQMNTTNLKTAPLSPNVTEMTDAGILFNTKLALNQPYLNSNDATDKYKAIPAPQFNFVNNATGVTITGVVRRIDPEDITFDVEPSAELAPGSWHMTIVSISDDVGNTSATISVPFTIGSDAPPVENAAPYVVWADAHDNIYDFRDGEYIISDVVHIQYSQIMKDTVFESSIYTINGNPLPTGLLVTGEPTAWSCGDCGPSYPTSGTGTLVTIHLPYHFLGDIQQRFITAVPGKSDVNPYAPMESNTLIISPNVEDKAGTKLAGVNNFTLTYHMEGAKQPHVVAYVNTLNFNSARLGLASYERAVNPSVTPNPHNFVSVVEFFELRGADGLLIDTSNPANAPDLNSSYTGDGDFVLNAPFTAGNISLIITSTPASVTVNANAIGNVTIHADNAPIITANGAVGGNLDINSANAAIIIIGKDVTGAATVNTPKGTVYVNADAGSLDIQAGSPASLIINSSVTIGMLKISIADHAFKVYNSGTINNIEIVSTTLNSADADYPGYVQLLGNGTYPTFQTAPLPLLPSGQDPDNRATKTSL
jgi:hypothetical protein